MAPVTHALGWITSQNDTAPKPQRILSGKGIKEHDRLLFPHELLESRYMEMGMSQADAHDHAQETYNYAKALSDYKTRNGLW